MPMPYNIEWVCRGRFGMIIMCGIDIYNLFILIHDKCEYMCKLRLNLEIPRTSILDYWLL